jgi:hypothetical protein
MTVGKCIWCGVDDASEYHLVELFGKKFLACEECFSIAWALMDRLSRIKQELGRRSVRTSASLEAREQR